MTNRERVLLESEETEDLWVPSSSQLVHRYCFSPERSLPVAGRMKLPDFMGQAVYDELQICSILWVGGNCGNGKSSRVPLELMRAHADHNPEAPNGVVHILPVKLAAEMVQRRVIAQASQGKDWVMSRSCHLWNGDFHEPAWSRAFWMLCTPAALLNKLLQGRGMADIRYVVFDELHVGDMLTLLALSTLS